MKIVIGKRIKTSAQDSAVLLTENISKWYVAIRNICIVAMLSVLVYIGIRMLLSTISQDKAKYKEMLKDWLVGLCLLFVMHYIMAFSVTIVQKFTDMVATSIDDTLYAKFLITNDGNNNNDLGKGPDSDKAKKFIEAMKKEGLEEAVHDGNGNWVWWTNLMGNLRLSMQFDKISGKYIGEAICFVILVIFTVIFTFTYLKRLLYMAFLTIIAPFVALTYCIDKINDGQAQGFNTWLKEYIFNLLIQPLHLMLYYILVTSAIDLAGANVIYSIVAIGFMIPAEKLLRSLFGFSKAHTPPLLGGALGTTLMMQGFNRLTGNVANGKLAGGAKGDKKGGSGSGEGTSNEEGNRVGRNNQGMGTTLTGGEPLAGGSDGDDGNSGSGNGSLDSGMPGDNGVQPEDGEQAEHMPTMDDFDAEQQELDDMRAAFSDENGHMSKEDRQYYWEMQNDLNRRRGEQSNIDKQNEAQQARKQRQQELLNSHKQNANEIKGLSPWAVKGKKLREDIFDEKGSAKHRGKIIRGARGLVQGGKSLKKGVESGYTGLKRDAHKAYSQFDKNMNAVAPKTWKRAKKAGKSIKNISKTAAKKASKGAVGLAVGGAAAVPLTAMAIAAGAASGDPSTGATAFGAAMAAGSGVGRRAANARPSDFISPEVQEAIDDVDNEPMYEEERREKQIKKLKKDENIRRELLRIDKDTGQEMLDNGHFEDFLRHGYTTDKDGLQKMVASEKMIQDKSPETAKINSVAAAASLNDEYGRVGQNLNRVTGKKEKEWRDTFAKEFAPYGANRASSMADETWDLLKSYQGFMDKL